MSFIPNNQLRNLVCKKGHFHQSLNMVCLNPLCQQDPLICFSCINQYHKTHKVIQLNKLLSDYSNKIKQNRISSDSKYSNKQNELIKEKLYNFKLQLLSEYLRIQRNLNECIDYLDHKINVSDRRNNLLTGDFKTHSMDTMPSQIHTIVNQNQLKKQIKEIIKNQHFKINNLYILELVKQGKTSFCELFNKTINLFGINYENENNIERQPQPIILTGLSNNIQNQKVHRLFPKKASQFMKRKNSFKQAPNQTSFFVKDRVKKISNFSNYPTQTTLGALPKDNIKSVKSLSVNKLNKSNFHGSEKSLRKLSDYKFCKYKHYKLSIVGDGQGIVSYSSGSKPQFALISPCLNSGILSIKEWSLKIIKCKDLLSVNTIGVGIGSLNSFKQNFFQQQPDNILLITSQGYLISNNHITTNHNKFTFKTGDILKFKYDLFYSILEIQKEDKQKIILKANFPQKSQLYICVRITYAFDQIKII